MTNKKKEISSKMYSNHRCGKCNRFGHSHEKCMKGINTTNEKSHGMRVKMANSDYPDAKPGNDYMGAR